MSVLLQIVVLGSTLKTMDLGLRIKTMDWSVVSPTVVLPHSVPQSKLELATHRLEVEPEKLVWSRAETRR